MISQSLVCVLPGKLEGGATSRRMSGSVHHRPVVTGSWQRLLNGCWLVGVVLKNTTNRSACIYYLMSKPPVIVSV